MKFYEKLSKLRKTNNLSQEQLAEKINVTRQAISKWESGESYPDMAKIIQLCKILNCSLNDLMDDGVMGEIVKEEKEDNKRNYLNDFLQYVTKTYNMFIHMSFRSKVIMLMEMLFIALVITIILGLLFAGIMSIVDLLLQVIPYNVGYIIRTIIEAIILTVIIILGVIIFLHLFKIRYLDYYVTISDGNVQKQEVEEPIEDNTQKSALIQNKNPKIIIRDPIHSSSRFFAGLANVAMFLVNALVTLCVLPILILFVAGVVAMVFAISQGGTIFYFFAIAVLGGVLICYIIIHLAYNFIFKRSQPYKTFLIILLIGLTSIGIGGGLFFNSFLTLENDFSPLESEMYKEHFEPADNVKLSFNYFDPANIIYNIVDDYNGIDVEIKHSVNTIIYSYSFTRAEDETIVSFGLRQDDLKTFELALKDMKNHKIRKDGYLFDGEEIKVIITCSQENFDKYIRQ